MKKFISAIVIFMLFAGVVSASSLNGEYNGKPIIKIISGGKEIVPSGTPAYADNGSTMVPVSMLRDLGFTVTYDKETQSVTVNAPDPVIKEVTKEVKRVEETTETSVGNNETPEKPTSEEPTSEPPAGTNPEPSPSPSQESTPSNAAACQAIKDDYNSQIVGLWYKDIKDSQKKIQKLELEYARDQALSNAGC